MKRFPVIIAIMGLLILVRVLINDNDNTVTIIAGINSVALLVVIVSITEQIKTKINRKLDKSGNPKPIIQREIKVKGRWISFISYSIIVVFSALYIWLLKSTLANDIVSIVSLGIAVCDTYIVEIVSNNIKL